MQCKQVLKTGPLSLIHLDWARRRRDLVAFACPLLGCHHQKSMYYQQYLLQIAPHMSPDSTNTVLYLHYYGRNTVNAQSFAIAASIINSNVVFPPFSCQLWIKLDKLIVKFSRLKLLCHYVRRGMRPYKGLRRITRLEAKGKKDTNKNVTVEKIGLYSLCLLASSFPFLRIHNSQLNQSQYSIRVQLQENIFSVSFFPYEKKPCTVQGKLRYVFGCVPSVQAQEKQALK